MNLEQLLQYRNKHVMERYQKDHPHNKLTAEEAWTELLKFFWLSHKRKHEAQAHPRKLSLKFHCAMHQEMKEIDDMWHTFLLFTQDYMQFCFDYFGSYIHHAPNTENTVPSGKKYETELKRYLSYIYDHLGETTLRKWFESTLNGTA